MKKAELVFIPAPGLGHLVSLIEFAKRLLHRDDRFSVTVLLMDSPFGSSLLAAYTKSLAESNTPISFINLPPTLDFSSFSPEVHKFVEQFVKEFIDSHKACVKEAIIKNVILNSNSAPLAGLVLDMFCTSIIDVGNELGVPSYLFFTSGAAFLGLILSLPGRSDQNGREFEEFDDELVFTTYVNPLPRRVLPTSMLDKDGGYNTEVVNLGRRFMKTKGIIVNSDEELESHAVKYLMNNFENVPPVYTVGPLIDLKGESNKLVPDETQKGDEIMKWLDDQPESSVVFLCFGSMGSFDEEQPKEIAIGLERCGARFLWSLRKPPPKNKLAEPSDYTSDHLQEILPNGFLERTKEMGMVCGWAPQKEVLAHKSVGGFVSHCGCNSILESLWFGVPTVAWPLYSEQKINAFQMVKDLGLAVELILDYTNNSKEVMLGDEIAKAIKCVMESDNLVRKKMKEKSEKSRLVVMDGGSSFGAYGKLIEDLFVNM